MADIRKRPIRLSPKLVLHTLEEVKIVCPQCGKNVEVDWLEKLEYPIQRIDSLVVDGFFVPMSIPLNCKIPSCQHSFHALTPEKIIESTWHLYGDEAGRYVNAPLQKYSNVPLNFFTITLVACHTSKREKLCNQLLKLKNIIPNFDPTKPLHFTKIWNTSEFFSTKNEKVKFAFKFAKIIKDFQNELSFYSISSCSMIPIEADQPKVIKAQKHETFQVSLLTTLAIFRDNKKSVKWVFDNVSDSSSGVRTEGWAEEIFLGLQYTRQFAWLSARAMVEKAEFVTPGSHYLLEIADFISFVIAREFALSSRGHDSEISSARLGKGFYCSRLGNGNYTSCESVGLPKRKFYGFSD